MTPQRTKYLHSPKTLHKRNLRRREAKLTVAIGRALCDHRFGMDDKCLYCGLTTREWFRIKHRSKEMQIDLLVIK